MLLFTDGSVPAPAGSPWKTERPEPEPPVGDIPAEYAAHVGRITDARTAPALKAFVAAGGTVVAVGGATHLAEWLGAPLAPALAAGGKALSTRDFYIPGSILSARFDRREPLAYGMADHADVFFDKDQSFAITGTAPAGVHRVGWFDTAAPLRSGWAIGQERLAGTTAVAEVDLGAGKLIVLGPEVTQRAQSYGTFKLLFNGLLLAGAGAK